MDPITLSLIIGGAGMALGNAAGIGGGMMTYQNQKKLQTRQFEFQEYMAKTAHQRQVEDLRKAGLNPILSALGGTGGTPSGGVPSAPAMDLKGGLSALDNIVPNAKAIKELDLLNAQQKKIDAETANLKQVNKINKPKERINDTGASLLDAPLRVLKWWAQGKPREKVYTKPVDFSSFNKKLNSGNFTIPHPSTHPSTLNGSFMGLKFSSIYSYMDNRNVPDGGVFSLINSHGQRINFKRRGDKAVYTGKGPISFKRDLRPWTGEDRKKPLFSFDKEGRLIK